MTKSVFYEMQRIDNILSQMAEEEYEVETASTTSTLGGIVGAGIGGALGLAIPVVGPIGALIGGAVGSVANSLFDPDSDRTATRRIVKKQTYSIPSSRYDTLVTEIAHMASKWDLDFSLDERLTIFFSLFNGCALFEVPQHIAKRMISSAITPEESDYLNRFLDFVYHQINCSSDYAECVGNYFAELDGPECPSVVLLYLFADAIAQYLPEEKLQDNLDKARKYYHRLPAEYKDFVLGKMQKPSINPAVHQYLLPQLERSPFPVENSPSEVDSRTYISRQVCLRLRIYVYYREADHMSLSAKLQAMFDSEEFAYQAAESVYSIQSILRDFAHTYGNMKVSRLNDIAETLFRLSEKYDDAELRKMARLVVLEAKLKHDLTAGIQLMHLRCREDVDQISQRLYNSIAGDKETRRETDNVESIKDIFDAALRFCLYRILYDFSDRKVEIARCSLFSTVGNFSDTRNSFEGEVIVNDEHSDEWLKRLDPPIRVEASFTEDWERLAFYKGSFASVLLEDLLGEFLFNAFKYADFSSPITLNFWSDERFFGITLTNEIPDSVPGHIIGSGLASRAETMALLNGVDKSSIESGSEGSQFTTTVRLRRTLLIQ